MVNKFRILLSLGELSDAELLLLAASIAALAPQSTLITVPAIATSVAAITTKAAALKAGGEAVKSGDDQLQNAKTVSSGARVALQSEVGSLMGLVTNNAKTEADVTGLAFKVRPAVTISTPRPLVPPPQSTIDVTLPKRVRGEFTATAHDAGNTTWHYAAEWSPDPVGPSTWSTLPGVGRSREGDRRERLQGLGPLRAGARADPVGLVHCGARHDPVKRRRSARPPSGEGDLAGGGMIPGPIP